MIVVSLPSDRPSTEKEIAERAALLRGAFPLTDEEFTALLRRLHARMAIEMDMGVFLAADPVDIPRFLGRMRLHTGVLPGRPKRPTQRAPSQAVGIFLFPRNSLIPRVP